MYLHEIVIILRYIVERSTSEGIGMKNIHRLVRYAGLVMVLFAVISLSGCVANPDNGNGQGTGGQGSELPFPVLTPEATSTPDEPQTIQPIVTPSPSATDGGQVLPYPNAYHDACANGDCLCA